jgi:glycosyltransferase involved in cell wall biosynthesis
MNEPNAADVAATIVEKDIVLDRGGAFSLNLPTEWMASNVFLVVDIYDLDNPVHPDGHVGWWRYEIDQLSRSPAGRLILDRDGRVSPHFDGVPAADQWRNPAEVSASRIEMLIVLRSVITNAILSIDRIPVMQSVADLEAFRSSFDRNYQSPRYTPPHYVLPADRQVHIVARDIFQRDAVGNLCLSLYKMLRQHQVGVRLFGENYDLAMNEVIDRRENLLARLKPNDIIIYLFSIHDSRLDELAEMKCARKIAYFHGVTPPKLLQVFDPELSAQCVKAFKQLPLLAKFDRVAANSHASADTLRKAFNGDDVSLTRRIEIIAPKLFGASESRLWSSMRTDPTAVSVGIGNPAAVEKPFRPTFIHVGRIISHKRIEDVLHLLAEYRKLDARAQLTIVGVSDSAAYRDYLRWVQVEELNLPDDAVVWRGSVSDSDLETLYSEASVYLSMSEHEGFCLPLLEAMMRGVLVFAYDQPAVREMAGMAGVIFSEKTFENLAKQLHFMLSSPETHEAIVEAQIRRVAELVEAMDGRGFLELLAVEPVLP